jgi:uncharacterized protein (DUF697 family)
MFIQDWPAFKIKDKYMSGSKDLFNIWKNLKEVDLRPFREAALRPVKVAIVGRTGVGRHTLAEQMRTDPQRPERQTQTALLISDLDAPDQAMAAELIILMLDATAKDFSQEQALAKKMSDAGLKVLAVVNKVDLLGERRLASNSKGWLMKGVLYGSVLDAVFLQREFIPVILDLLPDSHLALGRQFPLFRVAIAQHLISESCFANAAYSFSTGLAEVVPIFDLPLNITDTIVLTKAQAFLIYKLGLTLGFSTRWQDYLGEFGSVIGGGFVWRQVARMLIGLIPIWGIVPKVAVAYSGTYVVGEVVLQWYQTGRHITKQQMNAIYKNGLLKGKKTAQRMLAWLPRPGKRKAALLPSPTQKSCPFCHKPNAFDAKFCQYCGQSFQTTG